VAEVAKYKFTYRRPEKNPFRQSESIILDIPGHAMGHKQRSNTIRKGDVAYNVRCKCKWIDKEDGKEKWVPYRMRLARYATHIEQVKQQEVMDV
jgi:hypothetical protein